MTTSQMSSLKLIPIDEIDAQSWLNQSRKEYLLNTVVPVFNHLVESNLIDSFLEYWVDQELFNDTPDQKISTNNESNSTDRDTTKQDRINLSVLEWSYSHWGNKLESLYLQNKSMLDVVTFRLLRVENKNLSYELYMRLKENECSFAEISHQYGRVPEKNRGGLVSDQSLRIFPLEMQQLIGKMKRGEILKPFKYGNYYAIIQLEYLATACFDDEIKSKLIKYQYYSWRSYIVNQIILFLQSSPASTI